VLFWETFSVVEVCLIDGVTMVLPPAGDWAVAGTKFFLGNGVEIEPVVNFSIPETAADDCLYITLTLPLLEIKHSDKHFNYKEENPE
jgi:hypothetical protein